MSENGLKIKPAFRDLCPPLSTDERQQLYDNIVDSGIQDRIKVWDGFIIDGHNRYEIAGELGIDYDTEELWFDSEDEAKDWIIKNQLGRRNLDPTKASYLRGTLYNERKSKKPKKSPRGHFVPSVNAADEVAAETGVTAKTVKRDGKHAEAVDSLAPKARQAIQQKDVKASKKDIERLAEYDKPSQADIVERVMIGDEPNLKTALDNEEAEEPNVELSEAEQAVELAGEFRNQVRKLTEIDTWFRQMSQGPAGRLLQEHGRKLRADLKNAREAIKFAAPFAVCPYCGGEIDHELRACEACKGCGWVTKTTYDNAPSEVKQ